VKEGIHPKYQQATVNCACGNTWTTRSTRPVVNIDVCSACHPFFTGEQRIVDTAGQVERFMRRVENAQTNPRRKRTERREQKQELRRRQEEMRTNEEEVEMAVTDAPARRGPDTAAEMVAAMSGTAPANAAEGEAVATATAEQPSKES
jgi:large subunit ribosomal protein L31